MAPVTVQPTGIEHVVKNDELFFSITDRRGVIRTANSVFERIAHIPMRTLIGAPHNIIRHPAMPAGAFRLMWDRLLSDRPMAAYVNNLAADGGNYWVFATVTPMGEDFLSVRMAPAGGLLPTVQRLYEDVLQYEEELLRRGGLTRAQVAVAGAQRIEAVLRQLGFASYDAFMLDALPVEVAARGPLVETSFARPGASGPLARIMSATKDVDHRLDDLVARLDDYGRLAAGLRPSADVVLQHALQLRESTDAARNASAAVADVAPVLLNVATVMSHPMSASVEALDEVSPRLTHLSDLIAQQRFRVALTRLHTEMVAAFAAEAADGLAPSSALAQIPALCDVLHDDVWALARSTEEANEELHAVSNLVSAAGDRLQDFRRFLGQWRILVARHRTASTLQDLLRPIDAQLDAGHDQLDDLRALARACSNAVTPMDAAGLDDVLAAIRSSAVHAA